MHEHANNLTVRKNKSPWDDMKMRNRYWIAFITLPNDRPWLVGLHHLTGGYLPHQLFGEGLSEWGWTKRGKDWVRPFQSRTRTTPQPSLLHTHRQTIQSIWSRDVVSSFMISPCLSPGERGWFICCLFVLSVCLYVQFRKIPSGLGGIVMCIKFGNRKRITLSGAYEGFNAWIYYGWWLMIV